MRQAVAVHVRPLRTYNLPDISDHLIHFTGRRGGRPGVNECVAAMTPGQRLADIVRSGFIRASTTFGAPEAVTCFTESTTAAVGRLLAEGRYTPHGIAFTKQFVFDRGGGPVYYVRGDKWDDFPTEHKSMAVRFWPGATDDDGSSLPHPLGGASEWLHEREWRVMGDVRFAVSDIAYLITPYAGWVDAEAEHLDEQTASLIDVPYWPEFIGVPCVALSLAGTVISDTHGHWG